VNAAQAITRPRVCSVMIYQHAIRDRDKAIAQALGMLADKTGMGHDLAGG
jgi:hypothetical protein